MEINGTTYNDETPRAVVNALERAQRERFRVRVWYGNTDTGRAWAEEHDVTGYIGRSTGRVKIPLIVHNTRSMGGPGLLDHCIVRIDRTDTAETLYRHPAFSSGFAERRVIEERGTQPMNLPYRVQDDERQTHARFPTFERATRWLDFMNGDRYAP